MPEQIGQSFIYAERSGVSCKRATRSDVWVRTVQRSIELYYSLPEGSVRLDRSIIHPSEKIRMLRERWFSGE